MTRSRASAKKAGTRFERVTADYLRDHVSEFIDRRVKTGSSDRGDHSGVRCHGLRGVHECKDRARVDLAGALAEAEIQRGNDDALWAAVIHKRHGRGDPGEQLVTMTLRDYAALLCGVRPEEPECPLPPSERHGERRNPLAACAADPPDGSEGISGRREVSG